MEKKEEYKHQELTHKIIGCAMEVHKFLGNGFQEVIYQRALAYEIWKANLNFQREIEKQIYYKEMQNPLGTRRADFIIEEKVLLETKALSKLDEVHWAQTLNYLKAYKYEVGLLINFGAKSLEWKRFILTQ
ncbi:MAG: GxxExxY protein [Ginsengibacter sp.]